MFEIWPENAESCVLFFQLGTQWQVSMGGVVGLNYTAAEAVMRIRGVKNRARMFDDLRLMEAAVLKVWNAPKDKD